MLPEFPLVTIITPSYNRASFLDETVKSVLSQDYPNFEYIVLDDGSSDSTKDVIEKYLDQIIFESHLNMGEQRTVNKGFEMASGEIICVVNSDDPLLNGAIHAGVQALLLNPDALAAYPDWDEINTDSAFIKHLLLPDYDIENMLTDFNVGMGPGVFIRRSAIEKYGMRDLQFKYVGDLEFWFRLALHGKLVHIPRTLATHRTHLGAASVTDQGARMANELVRMVEKIYVEYDAPKDLWRIRNKALSRVHYVATLYSGNDSDAKRHHLLWSFRYAPHQFLWRTLKSFLWRTFKPFFDSILMICSKVKQRFV
jgi:glycosyltransferase involved in cell wall biosynthesis